MNRRSVIVATTAVLASAGSVSALAAWSHVANPGALSGTVGSLVAPSISAPTAGSQTSSSITVTWSQSTTSANEAATSYDVTRYPVTNGVVGSNGVTACGGSQTGQTCSDTSVPVGQWAYKVKAHYQTWTNTSAASGTVTVASAATHFSVSAASPQTAGTAFNFTVTALTASNATATGYTGTVRFTSNDAKAVLPSDYTFVAGDSGTHTFSATLKTAGSRTVTATDTGTSSITGTSGSITVSPATANKIVWSTQPPATQAKSTTFTTSPIVQVQDQYGNLVTGATGNVSLTLNNPGSVNGATLNGTTSVALSSGAATFTTLSINKAGTFSLQASYSTLSSVASNSMTLS